MKILVTGGAGFIGSHVVRHHLALGDRVFAMDDLSTGSMENVSPLMRHAGFSFQQADILGWSKLRQVVAWADRIYHLAAVVGMFRVLEQPIETLRVNIDGCERLLRDASRAGSRPQIVLASSSSVYGPQDTKLMHEEADITISPGEALANYALSKLTNEVQAAAYSRKHGLRTVAVRLFNTIGPGQRGMYGFVVPRFVRQAIANEAITVFGDGTQTRSFCDVRDTVAMLDALAGTPAAYGQVVNVGNAHEISVKALAELIRTRCHSKSKLQYVPYAQAYRQSFVQIPQRRPVLDRLTRLTGFRHAWSLERSIDDLIDHERRAIAKPVAASHTAAAASA